VSKAFIVGSAKGNGLWFTMIDMSKSISSTHVPKVHISLRFLRRNDESSL
jgi:hypothetical protein